jgi:hypothetical protein
MTQIRINPITGKPDLVGSSGGGGGGDATNLGYTASPTNGTVTSSTGADATLPVATGVNAGLMTPAQKTLLDNTSGSNTGDNATNTTSNTYADAKVADAINNGTTTIAPSQNAVFDALATKVDATTYSAITYASTLTIPCTNYISKYTVNCASNIAITLSPTGLSNGKSLFLELTTAINGLVVTFDSGTYTNKLAAGGVTLINYTFALAGTYFLMFEYDGTDINWDIADREVQLSGDVTTDTNNAATIGANRVTLGMLATLANGKVIGNLSGSTATPQALDAQEAIISNGTIITALTTETSWADGSKTVVGMLPGTYYKGTGSTGKMYMYTCTVADTALRSPVGDTVELSNYFGLRVLSTQYDSVASTTLQDLTGLSFSVEASTTYVFVARLYTTSNVAGGVKASINGTATATSIIYDGITLSGGVTTQTRGTALNATVGAVTAVTAAYIEIRGTIVVNAAGTLLVRFANNVATGTSSVLVGSSFEFRRL